jgi:hypothetical protein
VHGGLIVLGFLATWTVLELPDDQEPLRVTADFQNLRYEPLVRLDAGLESLREPSRAQQTPAPDVQASLEGALDARAELYELVESALPAPAVFVPADTGESATFVGLRATDARRIVYVIDASGSMIRSLPIVLEELARSLEALRPPQEFGVIFFQRNEAVVVPPASHLVAATGEAKVKALEWISRNVIPSGRSNPLAAIERALALRPDVVFMLSENITGSGQFEIDQEDLLELLERLNPPDGASGLRPARICCVQFLYPDPLDTLRRIAQRHGGPGGYRYLDAVELGIAVP